MAGTDLPDVRSEADVPADAAAYDVVVVGFGIAGGCAALEAARAGARVLLLERAAVHGGTSSLSGGHFYLGGGTAVQEATGHEDPVEEMVKYLTATSKEPEPDKIRAYCEGSVEHFDWLESLGFRFERSYYPEKAVIQPGTQGLMFTGNEKVWPFIDQARPAPRGHKVPVPGDTDGTKLVMDLLRDRVEEAGVEVRYETGATHLVTSADGRVVGVEWRSFDESGVVLASAVVLAAGGFVMNPDMVSSYTPALGSKLFTLGSTYDDGLGIRLGASVGGELKHMEEPFITAPFYPPSVLVTGIVVNSQESGSWPRTATTRARRTTSCSSRTRSPTSSSTASTSSTRRCHWRRSSTAGRPSRRWSRGSTCPTGSLAATLDRYNEHAARGEDPDFHKHPDWLAPQDQGPWGAYDLTLGRALYAGFTLGGLRTTVDGQVQRGDGSVVAGLYAAGACASNLAQDGAGYCSGTQLGEGSFFGRRAGRHAAAPVAHST